MRYAGFTTAATVLLGTAAFLWFGGSRAVAFDRVLDKVKQAESVTYVETQTIGYQAEMHLVCAIRGPMIRVEAVAGGQTRQIMIADTKKKVGLMLIPAAKAYVKIDKDGPGKIHGPAGKSPIDDLLALKDRKPESTVEEKLDGKTVQKLTIKGDPKADPPGDWVIWVDPKTELPVKMTYTGTTVAGDKELPIAKTYVKFEWNAKLDDTLFDMTVPAGYKEGFPGQVAPKKEEVPDAESGRTVFVNVILSALENAEKAKSVRIVTTTEKDGKTEHVYTLYRDGDLLRREEGKNIKQGDYEVFILNLKTRENLFLKTKERTAQRFDYPADATNQIKKIMDSGFKLDKEYADEVGATLKDLGEEKLGDRTTRTWVLIHPKQGKSQVWVDPKTQLLVRVRVTGDDGKSNMTIDRRTRYSNSR